LAPGSIQHARYGDALKRSLGTEPNTRSGPPAPDTQTTALPRTRQRLIGRALTEDLNAARAKAENRQLVEQPSPAELAVLHCLASGLSRREIGEQLYISLNTVKTHIHELYRKLDATSRADAVARAEALGLLDPTESPRSPGISPLVDSLDTELTGE
jgi:DNA-binding CsgD family transcriptional regulator